MSEVEMRVRNNEERNVNRGDDVRRGGVQENRLFADHAQEQQLQNERDGSRTVLQRVRDILLCRSAVESRQASGQQFGQPMAANEPIYEDFSDVRRLGGGGGEYASPGDHLVTGNTMGPSDFERLQKATASEKGANAVNQDNVKKSWAERITSKGTLYGLLGIAGAAGLITSAWALASTLSVPEAADDLVEVDFKPGEVISCNVLANDVPPASFDLMDYSSLELVGADLGSNGRTKTETGIGVWTASSTNGEITFTPDAALTALPPGGVSVQYKVKWAQDVANLTVKVIGPATLTIRQKGEPATTTTAAPTTTTVPSTTTVPTTTAMPTTTATPTTTTVAPTPQVMNFFQIVKKGSAFRIDFNEIIKGFASLNLDAGSIRLYDEAKKLETSKLDVANEGSFSVSTALPGTVDFQPVGGFAGFASPVMFTIANTSKVRSNPFTVSFRGVVVPFAGNAAVHEDLPKIDFDNTTPVAGQLPGIIPAGFASVTVVVTGDAVKPGIAKAGGLPLDPASVEIVGPVTMDGSMPTFRFNPTTSRKEMSVDGEGVWNVTAKGDITFNSAANFVRWPTAIAYTVKDTEGNISNTGLIEINPKLRQLQDAVKGYLTQSDDDFWAAFSTTVIQNANITNDGPGWKEIRLIVHTLWATAYFSLSQATRSQIFMAARYREADYAAMKRAWMTAGLSKSALLTVTANVTHATTFLASVPLGTRLIRLEIIRRLITEVYPPSNT